MISDQRDLAWNSTTGDFVVNAAGSLALVKSLDVIKSDLQARLTSPPGSHWAFPSEGVDMTRFVQAQVSSQVHDLILTEARQEIELACEQDARVYSATGLISLDSLTQAEIGALVTLVGQEPPDGITLTVTL